MDKDKIHSNYKLQDISTIVLIFSVIIFIFSRTQVDADLWGHLRFGLDALRDGIITQVDPYSYLSSGQRWINHEWLSEVLFAIAWRAGSSAGLILLKTAAGVLSLGLIYGYLLKCNLSTIRAGSLVILSSLAVFPAIATVRPHIFTLLFTAIVFIIIATAETGKYRWLWAAPPIFILWVNFHGGFLAGLGFLGIWTIIHTLYHPHEWRRIILPVGLCFLGVLINPYGLELITFLLRTATIARPEIVEWQSLELVSFLGAVYLILLGITVFSMIYSQKKKQVSMTVLVIIAAILPFMAVRHLPLFAYAVLVFTGEHIAGAWSRIGKKPDSPTIMPVWVSYFSLFAALVLLASSFMNFSSIKIRNEPFPDFPTRAVSILDQSQVSGNLAVEFNWGQYVIWHLEPKIKVSMDGRRETVYPDEIYKEYLAFQYGYGEWDSLIENHPTDLALVMKSQAAYNLMILKPGWELIYEDELSGLFANKDWSQLDILKKAALNFKPTREYTSFP